MADEGVPKQKNLLWRFFKSLKLTLSLLLILAVASVLGTLIPQQEGAMETARDLGPGLWKLLSALQLFDMYHSVWFRIILGLLAANLLVCSLDRFPSAWKLFRLPVRPDRTRLFEKIPPNRLVSVRGTRKETTERIEGILKHHYKGVRTKGTDNGDFLYAEKGRYSHFGVYIVHLSVLLILAGGLIGSFFGFEAYVTIPEGAAADRVTLRRSRDTKLLPFAVACDKFTIDYYENGTPKEYRSDLKFFQGDGIVREGQLRVNHPITHEGITFYQSSYGQTPTVHLSVSRSGTATEVTPYAVHRGHPVFLPGKEGVFRLLEAHDNFQGALGPAALLSIRSNDGKERQMWIFQNPENLKKLFPEKMLQSPKLNPASFEPYTFLLDRIENRYYSVLQVSRDPGVPLVWAGFCLIMLGLFMTFFFPHKRIWVRVYEAEEETKVAVAGKTAKNPLGMERELDQFAERLSRQSRSVQDS